MEQKCGRIGYIDAMKGFAIMCVVLGHTLDSYLSSGFISPANHIIYDIYNVIYSFHMPLFFALSGYVYSLVYFDENKCIKKVRIKSHLINLLCVYTLFCVLMWAFKFIAGAGNGVNHPVSLSDILMIWARPIAPYWYLYVLMALYLIFIPIIIKRIDKRIITTLTIILCALSIFISGNVWFQVHRILYYSIFFWIGISIQHNERLFVIKKWSAIALFGVSLLLMVIFWNDDRRFNAIPIANAVIAVGIICMCWLLFNNKRFNQSGGYSTDMWKIFVGNIFDSLLYRGGIKDCIIMEN